MRARARFLPLAFARKRREAHPISDAFPIGESSLRHEIGPNFITEYKRHRAISGASGVEWSLIGLIFSRSEDPKMSLGSCDFATLIERSNSTWRTQIRLSREGVYDFSYPSRRLIYMLQNIRYRYRKSFGSDIWIYIHRHRRKKGRKR